MMSKQDRDRNAVESVTNRFFKEAQQQGRQVSREEIRREVVRHQVRRDHQNKNK